MNVTTFAAHPYPYIQAAHPSGSRSGLTGAAGLRCVLLVDDDHISSGLPALVLKIPLEHAPTGIEHGFCHARLRQFQAAHIAYDDPLVLVDNASGKFMQGVFAPPRCVSMLRLPPRSTLFPYTTLYR